MKILTVCSQGLSRSVGLADVLKLHFEPVDVIPVGKSENANSSETLQMLCDWADHIIVMEPHYVRKLGKRIGLSEEEMKERYSVHVCDVGPDVYQGLNRRFLIDKVWRWARENQTILGITEHQKKL